MKNERLTSRAPRPGTPGGSQSASISHVDIAREAGVSPGLVSAFFSGNHYRKDRKRGIGISQATRKKIKETCLRLNYIPENPVAFYQIYPEKAAIGFMLNDQIMDGFTNPYHSLIFEGFVRQAQERDVDMSSLLFRGEHDYLLRPEAVPGVLQRGVIRKVAMSGGKPNYSLIYHLLRLDVNVVVVGSTPPIDGVVSVAPDFFEAGRLAVHTLNEHGHRQIAAVSFPYTSRETYNGNLMWEGFCEGKRELGLPAGDGDLLIHVGKQHSSAPIEAFLALPNRPTGVFCFDDNMARVFGNALLLNGLFVPGDVSIVGCNDDRLNREISPAYSTVRLPCLEIGRRAFDELNRIAVEGRPESHESILLPGTYIDRGSVREIAPATVSR